MNRQHPRQLSRHLHNSLKEKKLVLKQAFRKKATSWARLIHVVFWSRLFPCAQGWLSWILATLLLAEDTLVFYSLLSLNWFHLINSAVETGTRVHAVVVRWWIYCVVHFATNAKKNESLAAFLNWIHSCNGQNTSSRVCCPSFSEWNIFFFKGMDAYLMFHL